MGGGGVIRTVSKVASVGASASRGLRGVHAPAEHSASGVSRNIAAITVSPTDNISTGDVPPISVQRPAWELDDWEFAGDDGDLVMSAGEPFPRVVFGAVPSFQEAKEATDELKDALEKVYLSSPIAAEAGDSPSASQISDQYLQSSSVVEKKYTVISESAIALPAPKHAMQAFKLMSQSAAAQNVVASIASDPNVWNAVLQNDALMDFLQSQKATATEYPPEELDVKKTVEDAMSQNWESTKKLDETSSDGVSGTGENGFVKVLQDIKHAVEEMVSNVSSFLQNIFNPHADDKKPVDEAGDGGSTIRDTMSVSFMGLAFLTIMVVLLKRA